MKNPSQQTTHHPHGSVTTSVGTYKGTVSSSFSALTSLVYMILRVYYRELGEVTELLL